MNNIQKLLSEQKKSSFVTGHKASDSEAMGLIVAHHFEWDGIRILEALGYALEDANFHSENEVVQGLISALERSHNQKEVKTFSEIAKAVKSKASGGIVTVEDLPF